jgi:opacity protein-like surface antigen
MKKILTLAAAVALSTGALSANASDMYVKAGIGAASTKYKVSGSAVESKNVKSNYKKTTPIYMIGLGATVAEDTRVDFTVDYSKFKKDKVTGKTLKMLVNAEYDIVEITNGVKLYGAAGLGFTSIKASGDIDGKKSKFTWALGAGVNGKVTETIGWDLGYKYSHVAKIKGINVHVKPSQHAVMAGVKFHM